MTVTPDPELTGGGQGGSPATDPNATTGSGATPADPNAAESGTPFPGGVNVDPENPNVSGQNTAPYPQAPGTVPDDDPAKPIAGPDGGEEGTQEGGASTEYIPATGVGLPDTAQGGGEDLPGGGAPAQGGGTTMSAPGTTVTPTNDTQANTGKDPGGHDGPTTVTVDPDIGPGGTGNN